MADQRTPADRQDYLEALRVQARSILAQELTFSAEASLIDGMITLLCRMAVALDDAPTDNQLMQALRDLRACNQDTDN